MTTTYPCGIKGCNFTATTFEPVILHMHLAHSKEMAGLMKEVYTKLNMPFIEQVPERKQLIRIPYDRIEIKDGKIIYKGSAQNLYSDAGVELIGFELDADEQEAVWKG